MEWNLDLDQREFQPLCANMSVYFHDFEEFSDEDSNGSLCDFVVDSEQEPMNLSLIGLNFRKEGKLLDRLPCGPEIQGLTPLPAPVSVSSQTKPNRRITPTTVHPDPGPRDKHEQEKSLSSASTSSSTPKEDKNNNFASRATAGKHFSPHGKSSHCIAPTTICLEHEHDEQDNSASTPKDVKKLSPTGNDRDSGLQCIPGDESSNGNGSTQKQDSHHEKNSSPKAIYQMIDGKRSYRCSTCNLVKVTKAAVQQHILKTHENKEHFFECNKCLFKTLNPDSARQHMKRCENKMKCSFCDFQSTRTGDFKRHMKTHK